MLKFWHLCGTYGLFFFLLRSSRSCNFENTQGFALQAAAAVAAGVLLWGGSNALAADPLKTCSCLLKECRYVDKPSLLSMEKHIYLWLTRGKAFNAKP